MSKSLSYKFNKEACWDTQFKIWREHNKIWYRVYRVHPNAHPWKWVRDGILSDIISEELSEELGNENNSL